MSVGHDVTDHSIAPASHAKKGGYLLLHHKIQYKDKQQMSFIISYVSHGGWWWSVLTGGGSSSAHCVGGFCVREMSGGGMASTYHGGLNDFDDFEL